MIHLKKKEKFQGLFVELNNMETSGISMQLEESPASALQIVSAHMVKEGEGSYMRDYIFDETGKVSAVCFHSVGENHDERNGYPGQTEHL